MKAMALLSAALLVPGLVSGCASDPTVGYAATGLFREDLRTVAVPIFQNATYRRALEFELTDALIKEIEARTPYKVTTRGSADSILLGTIREVRTSQLSKSRTTGLSEEVIVGVTIEFEWRDLRDNQTLVARQSFVGHGLSLPSRPNAESIELGRFSAVQQLARDIVHEMRSEW